MIATVTAPVGVSGAVFLLPVHLSVLGVPNPAVTPTNLLYNVVATPGPIGRYHRQGQLAAPLTRLLILGSLPGVLIGATIRVHFAAGPDIFRAIAAAVLIGIGTWLLLRTSRAGPAETSTGSLQPRTIVALAVVVGIAGGIYGIGGGSILGPILVGTGLSVATVAPAALTATFVTSLAGALAYALLSFTTSGDIAPVWTLGLICGAGGLLGGYLGARLQPHLPERALRLLLGTSAIAFGISYAIQAGT